MPAFTAATVLSQFFTSDSVSTQHSCCFSANSSPLHVNFSLSSCLLKRGCLLSPRVSVSTSNAKIDGVDQQSLAPEEIKQDRPRVYRKQFLYFPTWKSADWKAAKTYRERGQIYEGKVEGFNGGGLLIRFYSLVGFLPFPQMSPYYSCKEPQKTIQEIARDLTGSVLSVKVIQADEDKRRLIFSEKDASWSKFSNQINVGDIFQARVGSVEDYGAFVHLRFPDGSYHLTGLVHVSEVSWDLVHDVRDILTEGDDVRVKIINIDRDKSRITLSIKQLEEDPLLETLDKVIHKEASVDTNSLDSDGNFVIEPLPGLETIIEELMQEDGIYDVTITRQGFEKRVVSQDLQLWLSNAPASGDQFTLLARAGRQVQEIQLTTSLDQEGIKRALQRVLERVP
ncbi:uncharacterized protein LOC107831599 isoform X1 [Nicotiana tabacum]|uniref:Uncharacterized protein LOC107831599 isoform X1 n=1 Tax=Nicotiana tabacum TaxID=4097 RepID=A0AC58SK41_TOBAC|nr:30S ribosomal protein S1 homolog isoform X1 [Nicotiana tomentosiformis]